MRQPGASPAPGHPTAQPPYPGTAVQAWHPGDTLVSLLSFFQERHGAGCLPLDTVPADALTRERRGQRGMGPRRPGRAKWGNLTPHSARAPCLPTFSLSPQPHPCGSFAPSSGDPIPTLALSCLQEAALWGQAKATFQTGVWEEAEGPAEGPSVPAVPATGPRCEDTPLGFGLGRPAPAHPLLCPREQRGSRRPSQASRRHPPGWGWPSCPRGLLTVTGSPVCPSMAGCPWAPGQELSVHVHCSLPSLGIMVGMGSAPKMPATVMDLCP